MNRIAYGEAIETEQQILAYMLVSRSAQVPIFSKIAVDDFDYSTHRMIFDAAQSCMAKGDAVNHISVIAIMHSRGQSEEIGGTEYIDMLISDWGEHADDKDYVSNAIKRLLIASVKRKLELENDEDVEAFLSQKVDYLSSLMNRLRTTDYDDRKTIWSVEELLTTEFPPVQWAVDEILPQGLTLLGGRAKIGKSWLTMQVARAVSTGEMTLGKTTNKSPVLVLSLEDSERRLRDRMRKQKWVTDSSATIRTVWPEISEGGGELLIEVIRSEKFKLIMVDTFSRFVGGSTQSDVGKMTRILGEAQTAAQMSGTALVFIDHHKKMTSVDLIGDVLGSTAKGACADAIWGLYRERGAPEAKLHVCGRDIQDTEITLKFDGENGYWIPSGSGLDIKAGSIQHKIIEALQDNGGEGTVTEVAEALGRAKSNLHVEFQELLAKGLVEKIDTDGKAKPYRLKNNEEIQL